jgi:hypothetical protein
MIHNSTPHLPCASRPIASPRITSSHPLEDALIINLELSKSGTLLQLQLEKLNTCTSIFFWIVAPFSAGLDLTTAPFFREPGKARFEWPSSRVMIQEGGVNASRVTDFECFEVGF